MFEEEMAAYTGSPHAIAVDSCTNALFLCCTHLAIDKATIPTNTYLSVPQAVINSGASVEFEDVSWQGIYQLKPHPIYDAAKRLTSQMYKTNTFMCLSFHIKKHLKIGKGGMILTDNHEAAAWFRKARYEGRAEVAYNDDNITETGWNMYMTPEQAARGLTLMQNYPEHNDDLFEDYKNLTEFKVFDYEEDRER